MRLRGPGQALADSLGKPGEQPARIAIGGGGPEPDACAVRAERLLHGGRLAEAGVGEDHDGAGVEARREPARQFGALDPSLGEIDHPGGFRLTVGATSG